MKLAVIVHVFYADLWPEIADCLRNVDVPFDLFVTFQDEATVAAARADFPSARFVRVENRGFDIAPFLSVLDALDPSAYTHVLKLHTKRDVSVPVGFNGREVAGPEWRNWLLSFVRTPERWAASRARIEGDGSVGMIAAAECILDRRATEGKEERRAYDAAVCEAARRFGVPASALRGASFVGGTMFLSRMDALALLRGKFAPADFAAADDRHLTNSFAHVAERLIGFAVCASGRCIESPDGDLARRRCAFRVRQFRNALMDFLYQNKVTSRGYRMIKVLRIMIWHRKI